MKKLKFKINLSFVLLYTLLLVAATVAIIELRVLDSSFNTLILDNYKTVESLALLSEAIEQEDKGILLMLSGDYEHGRQVMRNGSNLFNSAYAIARKGISIEAELEKLSEIAILHTELKRKWEQPIFESEVKQNIAWYQVEVHSIVLAIKQKVYELSKLHQQFLYQEASLIKENSRRAIMPGIVSIIASLLFALILNFYIVHYFVVPVSKINQDLKTYKQGQITMDADSGKNKELHELIESINEVIRRLVRKQTPVQ